MAGKIVDAGAVAVATLAQRMVTLYFGHVAAMYVARDPRSDLLAPPVEKAQIIPVLKFLAVTAMK